MPGKPTLPYFIKEFVLSASKEQRTELQSLLNECSDSYVSADTESESEMSAQSPPHSQISEFVCHVDKLPLSSSLSNDILNELTSLKLRTKGTKGKPAKVKTQWLCPRDNSYDYGSVVNKPRSISDFPNICKLMDMVNSHPDTSGDMSACLISCMSTKDSNLSYHADDEPVIDQSSDIFTVSFGSPRTLDFILKKDNKHGRKGKPIPPSFSVPATNHSMNIMKAGSQTDILHRVPPVSKGGVKYSLSFRKLVAQSPPTEDSVIVPTIGKHEHKQLSNTGSSSTKKKVVLLAGDSYFHRLDEEKLGKGKQPVYKVAKGGRKIDDILHSIKSFVDNNQNLEIKQLFVCVATSEFRYCREKSIWHLKTPLQSFFTSIKQLAPNVKIYVQSLLPIPSNGNRFGERNVLDMNRLLFGLCSKNRVFFVDAFTPFLNSFGNRNLSLFPKRDEKKQFLDIHPNDRGMGVLARQYIFLIHSRRFNTLAHN